MMILGTFFPYFVHRRDYYLATDPPQYDSTYLPQLNNLRFNGAGAAGTDRPQYDHMTYGAGTDE
jgi:hypothetical protein